MAPAARLGILIKGGVYLEEGRKLRVLALDKTGTVTRGQPEVTDVVPLDGSPPERALELAASLDAHQFLLAGHGQQRGVLDPRPW